VSQLQCLSVLLFITGVLGGSLPAQAPGASQAVGAFPARAIRFETTQGTAMNVDVSPDGKTIVFDLLGDLYTVPVTGGTARRLTSGPAFDTEPVFSPDGQRIAFVSDRSGRENLWVIDADGRHTRAFTEETGTAVSGPEWVTAGEFVLVARTGDSYWLYRADGSGTALDSLLPKGARLGNGEVAWTRDGRFIYAFADHLSRIDVAQGTSEAVSEREQRGFRPVISPDGRWMVFATQLENQTGLRLLDVATQKLRWLIYPLPDRDNSMLREPFQASDAGAPPPLPRFAFLPDGKAILIATGGTFQRLDLRSGTLRPIPFRARVEQELGPRAAPTLALPPTRDIVHTIRGARRTRGGERTIFTALGKIWIREGSGPAKPLVEQPPAPPPLVEHEPALSPDGKWVAYVTWHDVEGGQLWRVPVNGGRPAPLMKRRGVYRHPVWSPDGSRLAVVREEEQPNRSQARQIAGEVYVLPAAGGAPRRVAGTQAEDVPAFSADGEAVLVLVRPATGAQPGGTSGGSSAPVLLSASSRTGRVDTVATLPVDVEQVAVSPDGESVAYTKGEAVYAARITPVAGLPPRPATVTESGGLWPATRVAQQGGEDLSWEADGRTLSWVRGGALVRVDAARTAALAAAVEVIPLASSLPRAQPSSSVALEGATVITMRGDEVLRDATVLVTGDRIAAVGPRGSVQLPAGAHRVDVGGKTIIPGLIDVRGEVPFARDLFEGTNLVLAANLSSGVTTIRTFPAGEVAAALRTTARYAERLETGAMTGSRLLAGSAVTSAQVGDLASLDAARAFVRRQQELGVAAIVLMSALSRQQRQWLAAAARDAGMPLVGESGNLRLALTMAADGYHAIQGTIPDAQFYDDVRRLLAASGVVYVPTLLAATGGRRGTEPGGEDRVGTAEDYFLETTDVRSDPKLRRFGFNDPRLGRLGQPAWRLREDYHFLAVGKQAAHLAALGAPVAVGTAGKRPGLGVHWEIWALGMGGFSAHEALRAATVRAAEALGLASELGTIEVGKVADLVVLDADPLADLQHSRATRYVMRSGTLFDAATLATIWPRATPPLPLRDTRYDPPPIAAGVHARTASGAAELKQ
jgi:Tol biopolymer transport system component/imidazolonepropionase-like amidohydrolase